MSLSYLTPLKVETLRAHGVPEPWTYGIADRTRFGELDALAHINNTAYLRWFEAFRIHYFRDYGISDYGPRAPRIVLRQVQVDYLREMGLDEDYIVTGRTVSYRTSSFRMDYAVWAPDLRATGSAIIVCLGQDGRKAALPESVRATLTERDQAMAEA